MAEAALAQTAPMSAAYQVSDSKMRFQFAQVLQDQGIHVDEFIRLCDVNDNGTIEKVELVLVLKNMAAFEIDEILQLSKILLPNAIDSTQNFRRKLQVLMEDYEHYLVNNDDLHEMTEMKVSPSLKKRMQRLDAQDLEYATSDGRRNTRGHNSVLGFDD